MKLHNRTIDEYADQTGDQEGTLKSRAHRARKQLRAALRHREPARDGGGR
jgi:DNA-directed RNA polymerase specialized sigma24 family protein